SEHISTETFINDIEREFINSSKVRMVQGGEAREELRTERADQQDFASLNTAKKWGLEKGADFILQGTINSITDSNSKEKIMYYQVDLTLTSLESNEKVWIGSKKIKKVIK
ncbi:MAG: PBP1b-binding outer membrane lipoprotein LpoB, partial [Marivirga sp.]